MANNSAKNNVRFKTPMLRSDLGGYVKGANNSSTRNKSYSLRMLQNKNSTRQK